MPSNKTNYKLISLQTFLKLKQFNIHKPLKTVQKWKQQTINNHF